MFRVIFSFELFYWLRQSSVWVYTGIFLFFSMLGMAGSAQLFDPHTPTTAATQLVNSPAKINEMFEFWTKLMLFLLPTIMGYSVYRDFKSRTYTLLYSYPIDKKDYLLAKFLSALLIMLLIVSGIGLGIFLGTQLPGVNPALLAPFKAQAYWQAYSVYVIPNIVSFGALVFAIVLLSRNIYAGFIAIVCLFLIQGLFDALIGGLDNHVLRALLDPFGSSAGRYYSAFQTQAEQNNELLPLSRLVLLNRILWLSIALGGFALAYRRFSLSQLPASQNSTKKPEPHSFTGYPGRITKVRFSTVQVDFSLWQQLKTTWYLSVVNFLYIIKNRSFLAILVTGFLFVFFQQMQMNPPYGVKTLPVTWKLLRIPGTVFSLVILMLTYLFAGVLVHREGLAQMNQLVDATPAPNWVLLFSKFLALIKMQLFLLSFIMLGGLLTQLSQSFYQFEIGHYLFELYGLNLINFIIWAFAAIFIQTLFTNPYLGLFLLILGTLGMAGLPELGIHPAVFRYNMGPDYNYSDLDGYGSSLLPYLSYKLYWAVLGLFLLLGALCWWRRGLTDSFAARFRVALNRLQSRVGIAMLILLAVFLSLGYRIYYEDTVLYDRISTEEEEDFWRAEHEKKYKSYQSIVQPRITAVKVNMHLYPEDRSFVSDGNYTLVNKSAQNIDTLLVHHSFNEITEYRFERKFEVISQDSNLRFDILRLQESLAPGDSLKMFFELHNKPNTRFHTMSKIKGNGTFINNNIFPGLGYRPMDLASKNKRSKYGLPELERVKALPSDSTALYNSYSAIDADWIKLETIISTTPDQIAIAPGYLQREWEENKRRYFHYKMDHKIKDYYGFNSGRFEFLRDQWKDVQLEIYYHKSHSYNLQGMMKGLKGALEYNSKNFSPYQHKQARIIEFPITLGTHGTTFANSIPLSEIFFVSDVNESDPKALDLPFFVTAHEMAHQWWGNQLLPADVLGAKMLTESMAEYTALKVMEKEYGPEKVQAFLELNRYAYLKGRSREKNEEMPLILAYPHQEYISYRKGALALYTLSEYIGEDKLNKAIKKYLEKVQFQDAPYTTSLEMLEYIRAATPDSLQYLITDWFETITFYDNQLLKALAVPLENGNYQLNLEFNIRKYRSESPEALLPLADYIEIGIFAGNGELIERQKHKVVQQENILQLIIDQKPASAVIDPFYKTMETDVSDNQRDVD